MFKSLLLTLIIFAGARTYLQQLAFDVAHDGPSTITQSLNGHTIAVSLNTHQLPNGVFEKTCTKGISPCSILDDLRISVDGKDIFIPKSASSKLSDINTADVSYDGTRYRFRAVGGDGAESYIVTLWFNSRRVSERMIVPAEFPEDILERTKYKIGPAKSK